MVLLVEISEYYDLRILSHLLEDDMHVCCDFEFLPSHEILEKPNKYCVIKIDNIINVAVH